MSIAELELGNSQLAIPPVEVNAAGQLGSFLFTSAYVLEY